jgi:hypothetical protein
MMALAPGCRRNIVFNEIQSSRHTGIHCMPKLSPTVEEIEALRHAAPPVPVVMVNLLKFRGVQGRIAYAHYVRAGSDAAVPGMRVVYSGRAGADLGDKDRHPAQSWHVMRRQCDQALRVWSCLPPANRLNWLAVGDPAEIGIQSFEHAGAFDVGLRSVWSAAQHNQREPHAARYRDCP